MGEQIILDKRQGRIGKRMIKKATRVDLTPMVDLGFLLITFFVFTTTMSTTTAMGMQTPNDKKGPDDPVCESCALTVIPAANNKLYYYEGVAKSALYKTIDYSATGLRKLLTDKKRNVSLTGKNAILIIKPSDSSSFKNLINIIDESTIAMYKKYYIDELNETDRLKMKQLY